MGDAIVVSVSLFATARVFRWHGWERWERGRRGRWGTGAVWRGRREVRVSGDADDA